MIEADIEIVDKLLKDFPVVSASCQEQVTTIRKYKVWNKSFRAGEYFK
jgi:hypothetical protein